MEDVNESEAAASTLETLLAERYGDVANADLELPLATGLVLTWDVEATHRLAGRITESIRASENPIALMAAVHIAGFDGWPVDEQALVRSILLRNWTESLCDPTANPSTLLEAIGQVDAIQWYLDAWAASRCQDAAVHLASFIDANAGPIIARRHLATEWAGRRDEMRSVINWLKSEAPLGCLAHLPFGQDGRSSVVESLRAIQQSW